MSTRSDSRPARPRRLAAPSTASPTPTRAGRASRAPEVPSAGQGTERASAAPGAAGESPFETPELLAFDRLLRTASALDQQVARLLKPAAVTPAQYNVLRILRGAGAAGLPCGAIAERLVRHDPDVTRLLDRLEAQGFVARARDTHDRRVVIARLTRAGAALLEALGPAVAALHAAQFAGLARAEFHALTALLERLGPAED